MPSKSGTFQVSKSIRTRCCRITMPGWTTKNDRSVWVIVERRYEGSSLYPIGLEFRVNISATCPCQWNVDAVWFRSQSFANMEELVDAYHNNRTAKETIEMYTIADYIVILYKYDPDARELRGLGKYT